ncbi:MAG: hypothetical protein ABF652_20250 [Clostridium beijerinckii]
MKIVSKLNERKKEKELSAELLRIADQEKQKRKEAAFVPEIIFVSDWRIEQEYEKAVNTGILFPHQVDLAKTTFLKQALENRDKLKELVIEEYEPNRQYPKYVSMETTKEYIQTLQDEARKAGIEYDQYIRAIYYTTALEINNSKAKLAEEFKVRQEESKTFEIKGEIDQELRRKLESKYGQPIYSNTLFYTCTYGYTDMLIDLAKEYFGIEK